MGARTSIEWCAGADGRPGASWNPIRARNRATGKTGWHCEHVHEGCRHCYAEAINRRRGAGLDFKPGNLDQIELFLDERILRQPLKWKEPRKVFVCSMTDLFGRWVAEEWLDRIFAVMALCPQLTFIILTKRPERMRGYITILAEDPQSARLEALCDAAVALTGSPCATHIEDMTLPPPNIWGGTSGSTQEDADKMIPEVLATPLAKRIVSLEPLLGPIDIRPFMANKLWNDIPSWKQPELDWVICGGESGLKARPMHPDWARSLRDQCQAAGVPFFFKQWGEHAPALTSAPPQPGDINRSGDRMVRVGRKSAGRRLDGREHSEFPA